MLNYGYAMDVNQFTIVGRIVKSRIGSHISHYVRRLEKKIRIAKMKAMNRIKMKWTKNQSTGTNL